ncbi:hypothetical protein CTA2_7269 [Colletotrichum tanaceti]|uniref:Metal tolerance protein 3 n=1 Tax=Colletotrichum tanaceti TaxID=1306861 RepID=A0A4U6XBA0_9PEZI|nr:hypothetical protein CTA2_7269 [Colletotrichum tanaceti]TKW52543.1 hypothetical protein CTA1_13428 [Colletotrichum tanaceti]
MHNFVLAQILLAVSVFTNGALAKALVVRQTAPTTGRTTAVSCGEYARIANLSAVGTNSSYRATFFEASPAGNSFNAAVLDTAIAKLPSVIMDRALNEACGNLTALAIREAANNFTIRTVLQFSNIPPAEPLDTSFHVLIACAAALTFMGGTWVAMP